MDIFSLVEGNFFLKKENYLFTCERANLWQKQEKKPQKIQHKVIPIVKSVSSLWTGKLIRGQEHFAFVFWICILHFSFLLWFAFCISILVFNFSAVCWQQCKVRGGRLKYICLFQRKLSNQPFGLFYKGQHNIFVLEVLGPLEFALCALRALRPCDPRRKIG